MAFTPKPSQGDPRWADQSGANISTPDGSKLDLGWSINDIPPASWQNWWQNLVQKWVKWAEGNLDIAYNVLQEIAADGWVTTDRIASVAVTRAKLAVDAAGGNRIDPDNRVSYYSIFPGVALTEISQSTFSWSPPAGFSRAPDHVRVKYTPTGGGTDTNSAACDATYDTGTGNLTVYFNRTVPAGYDFEIIGIYYGEYYL